MHTFEVVHEFIFKDIGNQNWVRIKSMCSKSMQNFEVNVFIFEDIIKNETWINQISSQAKTLWDVWFYLVTLDPPSPPKIRRHLLMFPFRKCFDPVICSDIEKYEAYLIHFLAMPFKKCSPNDLKYFISCDSP